MLTAWNVALHEQLTADVVTAIRKSQTIFLKMNGKISPENNF